MQLGWRPVQGDELDNALDRVIVGQLAKLADDQLIPIKSTLTEMQTHIGDLKANAARAKVLQKLGHQGIAEQLDTLVEMHTIGGEHIKAEDLRIVLEDFNEDLKVSLTRFAEHTDIVLRYMDQAVERLTRRR